MCGGIRRSSSATSDPLPHSPVPLNQPRWTDGPSLVATNGYTNWRAGEPSSPSSENCVTYESKESWVDLACTLTANVHCEISWSCTPDCDGSACGTDGCGGTCPCAAGSVCNAADQLCIPFSCPPGYTTAYIPPDGGSTAGEALCFIDPGQTMNYTAGQEFCGGTTVMSARSRNKYYWLRDTLEPSVNYVLDLSYDSDLGSVDHPYAWRFVAGASTASLVTHSARLLLSPGGVMGAPSTTLAALSPGPVASLTPAAMTVHS